jgi:hypothetical protein
MYEVGQVVNGWLVESGPCKSKSEAEGYAYSLRPSIKWKVAQDSGGRWFLLVKE